MSPEKKQQYSYLRKTFRLVWQEARSPFLGQTILSMLEAVLPLAFLFLLKQLIDMVTTQATAGEWLPSLFWWLLAAMGVVFLLQDLARTTGGWVHQKLSSRLQSTMYDKLHARAVRLDLHHFEQARYYNILNRALREAPYRPALFIRHLIDSLRGSLALLLMIFLLTGFHYTVALVLLAINLPLIGVRLQWSRKMYQWRKDQTERERRIWYVNWLLTGERAATEQRLFGLGPFFRKRFKANFRDLKEEETRLTGRRALAESLAQIFKTLGVVGAFGLIFYQTARGQISTGSMVMYLLAFQRGLTYLRDALTGLAGLHEDSLFLGDVFDFTSLEVSDEPQDSGTAGPLEEIRFEKVGFRYPGKAEWAVRDLTFSLKKGEILALAGPNGAGKTTVVKLLCRLYTPEEGRILLNGRDLQEISPSAYKKLIATVFQDFMLYRLSIEQNIAFGDVTRPTEEEELWVAARKAGVAEVIHGQKRQMETLIGSLFGDSTNLSWGEWQKLALARALYRNSPLLVLDEPTSAMDAYAEADLLERFQELQEEKTCLLISHRMANLRQANRILMLDKGRKVEEGSHEQLMQQKGMYYELFSRQATRYAKEGQ